MQARPLRNLKQPSHRSRSDLGIGVLVLYMVGGHVVNPLRFDACFLFGSRDCCVAKFFAASAVPGGYTWSQKKIQEHK